MADARSASEPATTTASGPGSVPPGARPETRRQPEAPPQAAPRPRYPAQALTGAQALWRHTQGDPGITIGVVDGPPQLSHPSLTGADLQSLQPWRFPPAVTMSPHMAEHGTWTASVLFGQPGSNLPGLVPRCRGLVVCPPIDDTITPDPLFGARAVDELLQAGADVIQFTPAFYTASGDADDLFKRAIARAVEQGVLVTAPAGNDYGRNSAAPAILPGVLAVGAHRTDGTMFSFSNHGPHYAGHGLTALGEAVLGAHPSGGVKAQKGTCVAVALATGAAALLLSLQRHLGHRPDPLAVRDALLSTARPCTPAQTDGQPERCLNGHLDLPAAAAHLIG